MNLDRLYFCGTPEPEVVGAQPRRRSPASWFFAAAAPAQKAAVQAAFDAWSAVAGCSASEAPAAAGADLLVVLAPIDGPFGILAQCELPGPRVQHLTVDAAEQWVIQLGPAVAQGKIDLGRVLRHELGHFWGLGHDAAGSGQLMAPTYSAAVDAPRANDAARMVALYGPPAKAPPPPPPGGSDVVIRVVNAERILIDGYKVTKL